LFAHVVSLIFGCIGTVSGVRAAAPRWCEVLPVGRPRRECRAYVQVHIPQRANTACAPSNTSPTMQPSPLRTIGACTYRRLLSLCRPTLARAQRCVARLALRRTLHFRVFVVASSIKFVLGDLEGILRSWCRCTALLELASVRDRVAVVTVLQPGSGASD
jgi:hypothetical protein